MDNLIAKSCSEIGHVNKPLNVRPMILRSPLSLSFHQKISTAIVYPEIIPPKLLILLSLFGNTVFHSLLHAHYHSFLCLATRFPLSTSTWQVPNIRNDFLLYRYHAINWFCRSNIYLISGIYTQYIAWLGFIEMRDLMVHFYMLKV